MPIAWRPEKTLQDFIKENSHSRQREQERYQGRVFNDKGHVRKRFTRNDQHNIHDIEGSLEVQRQLLLKLAERENAMMERLESGSTSSVESLESLKADTVQAIQKTWNQRSRFITKRRLLYTLL
jgi:hypothetical protein